MNFKNAAPFPRLRAAYLRAIAKAWHDPDFLQLLVRQSEFDRGALPLLEETYNFNFPFDVKFCVSDQKRPLWRPIGTTGWFGFGDEFTIFLPEPPSNLKQCAAVLARYCAEYPSLLGSATISGVEAPPDFAAFGVITSRLLALVWHNRTFADALFASEDARALVQDSMDVIVDWNFNLKFRRHPGPADDSDAYWKGFSRSIITVHIPETPPAETVQRDENAHTVEPIALAAYNGTGSQYPFTCA